MSASAAEARLHALLLVELLVALRDEGDRGEDDPPAAEAA